jgi:hypothetical protein
MGPIHAIRKIAGGLSHGNAGLFHGIRFSDYMIQAWLCQANRSRSPS